MAGNHLSREDTIIFRIAQLFFQGDKQTSKVSAIAAKINAEFKPTPPLTRESIYPLLAKAKLAGFVKLVPPPDKSLAATVAKEFNIDIGSIRVVHTLDPASNYLVADAAADLVLDIIKRNGRQTSDAIGVGLGPGRATLDFSHHLSGLIRSDMRVPPLRLHAITAGCPARLPEYSPTSFFPLFPRNVVGERIGMFAEMLVPADKSGSIGGIKERPGVSEAFEERGRISIVCTSMGDIKDKHDLLRQALQKCGVDPEDLIAKGWIGNLQYRGYSATAPIIEHEGEMRAVTLFELKDFVELARTKGKHVVLIARQCALCGMTRAAALRPLLAQANLRVWSEVVMDTATATELLDDSASTA